ncbi:hypothetical protein MASR2M117_25260 [Paludibacter sp.]
MQNRNADMKLLYFPLLVIFLSHSIEINSTNKIDIQDKFVSFGKKTTENRMIDVIIIHSAYNALGGNIYDVDKIIKQFAKYKVSPHYLIDRQGSVYQMIKEQDIAYHAGKSILPDGGTGVNSRSIGIEIINSLDDSPTAEQMETVTNLVLNIKGRYHIKYLLRHSDIAPGRKTDPWNFDWDSFINKINEVLE